MKLPEPETMGKLATGCVVLSAILGIIAVVASSLVLDVIRCVLGSMFGYVCYVLLTLKTIMTGDASDIPCGKPLAWSMEAAFRVFDALDPENEKIKDTLIINGGILFLFAAVVVIGVFASLLK